MRKRIDPGGEGAKRLSPLPANRKRLGASAARLPARGAVPPDPPGGGWFWEMHWHPDAAAPDGGWWHDPDTGEVFAEPPIPPEMAGKLGHELAGALSWRSSEVGRSLTALEQAEVSAMVRADLHRRAAQGGRELSLSERAYYAATVYRRAPETPAELARSRAYWASVRAAAAAETVSDPETKAAPGAGGSVGVGNNHHVPQRRYVSTLWEQEHYRQSRGGTATQRTVEILSQPHAFRNYDYLRLRTQCEFAFSELFARWWKAFFDATSGRISRSWPLFAAAVDGDAVQLGYFETAELSFAPHNGGRVRELTAPEWQVIAGVAFEQARASQVEIAWDAANPSWFRLIPPETASDKAHIRANREACLDALRRNAGVFVLEDWLDRYNVSDEEAGRGDAALLADVEAAIAAQPAPAAEYGEDAEREAFEAEILAQERWQERAARASAAATEAANRRDAEARAAARAGRSRPGFGRSDDD